MTRRSTYMCVCLIYYQYFQFIFMSKISSNFLTMFALIQQEVSKGFILYMCLLKYYIYMSLRCFKKIYTLPDIYKVKTVIFLIKLIYKKNQVYIGKTSFVLLPSTYPSGVICTSYNICMLQNMQHFFVLLTPFSNTLYYFS